MPDINPPSNLQSRQEAWRRHRRSEPYKTARRRLLAARDEFIGLLQVCWFASTRVPELTGRSFVLRSIDDMLECAVVQEIVVRQTARNTAKREMRYLLELAVKGLFVDQKMPTAPFDQRLVFFERKVSSSGLERELRQLDLFLLDDAGAKAFRSAVISAFGAACQYVHPSIAQIEDRLSIRGAGVDLGFDTAELVDEFAKVAFDVYGLVAVIVLHSIGSSIAGDVLEGGYGDQAEWQLRRHPYVTMVDAFFDYKAERQERLVQLKEWRQQLLPG